MAAAIAYFAVVAAALFRGPLLAGLSLVPWQISYMIDDLYRRGAEQVLDRFPNNSILYDVAFQFFPWSTYSLERLRDLEIPLWNPHALAGLPFVANHQSGVFELTKLTGFLLGFDAVWWPSFSWPATIALAGFFTWLFLRHLGLAPLAAAVGGTAYALSGPMVVWLGWPHASTAMWLPWLLLAFDKTVSEGTGRWIAGAAVGTAFLFFAGHLQVAWYVMFTVATWTAFRVLTTDRRRSLVQYGRALWPVAAALALGLGLAAIQLWPTSELLAQSSMANGGRGLSQGMSIADAAGTGRLTKPHGFRGGGPTLLDLGLFVYPDLYGNSETGFTRGSGNTNEAAVYIGVVALALSLTSLTNARSRRHITIFWCAAAFIYAGAALSIPGPALLNYLPVFNLTNVGRLRFLAAFALAVLAGLGAQVLLEAETAAEKRRRLIFPAAFAVLALSTFGWLEYAKFLGLEASAAKLVSAQTALLPVLGFGVVGATRLLRTPASAARGIAGAVLVATVAFELLSYGTGYRGGIDPGLVAPENRAVTWLQERAGTGRIASFKDRPENRATLFPNSAMIFGLYDIRGYEVLKVNRFEQLQQAVAGGDPRGIYRKFEPDFFRIGSVKYFIQKKGGPAEKVLRSAGLKPVFADGDTRIWRDDSALPRAFVVYRTTNVRDTEAAARLFKRHAVDFRRQAIVEAGPALAGEETLTPIKTTVAASERVAMDVNIERRGLLVLTDAYYPGWRAYIDGRSARIYPANVAFRGVVVPKGRHRVEFVYKPDSFRYALYLFWPSLALIVFLAGADLFKRGRAGKPRSQA